MKQLRSLFLLLLFALLPLAAGAQEKGGGEKLDIPEIVLEHLSDSYESVSYTHLTLPTT